RRGQRCAASPAGLGPVLEADTRERPAVSARTRQLAVRCEQLVDHVDQRPPPRAGLGPDPLESLAVADPVPLHQNPLRPLDLRPPLKRVEQLRVLLVALEGNVDPTLELRLVG